MVCAAGITPVGLTTSDNAALAVLAAEDGSALVRGARDGAGWVEPDDPAIITVVGLGSTFGFKLAIGLALIG
jgi:hypothetical protein